MLTLLLVLLSNAYFFNENVTLLYLNTIASVYLHPIQKNVINSLVFFFASTQAREFLSKLCNLSQTQIFAKIGNVEVFLKIVLLHH